MIHFSTISIFHCFSIFFHIIQTRQSLDSKTFHSFGKFNKNSLGAVHLDSLRCLINNNYQDALFLSLIQNKIKIQNISTHVFIQ